MAFRTQTGETDLFDSAFAQAPTNVTLHEIEAIVDWHRLRDVLAPAYDRSGVGRPGHDPVLLAKLQILIRLYSLSDERVCHEAADRLSFRRFLGLTAADLVPDSSTLTRFRERLRAAGLEGAVSSFFDSELERHSLRAKEGEMKLVDATIIPAATRPPKKDEPAGKRDTEARHAVKHGKTHFGFKVHAAVEAETKLVRAVHVTPANVHDSQAFTQVLDGKESIVLADKAYHNGELFDWLREKGVGCAIMLQGRRGAPLPEELDAWWNKRISPVRCRVEHAFAHLKRWRGMGRAVYVGTARVRTQVTWAVVAYNLRQAVTLLNREINQEDAAAPAAA